MIIRFSAENYRSIRDKQELTLVATSLKDSADSLVESGEASYSLLPVAAIYGANASGKTNILRALNFILRAVENSHRRWEPSEGVPRKPFALDDSRERQSSFEIEFILKGTRYRYGFALDSERVQEEWLYAYPNGKQQQWFARSETPQRRFNFGRNLPGENNRIIEQLTRPNSLYLSAAAQNNHEGLVPIYNFLVKEIRFSFSRRSGDKETERMCSDESYKAAMLRYLRAADFGITGVRTEKIEISRDMKKVLSALQGTLPPLPGLEMPNNVTRTMFQHQGQSGAQMELRLQQESEGTVAYFSLLGPVIKTIESGGVLCIDGLDSSLHPLLAIELVRNFTDRKRNPLGAQLVFNTHDTNLLDNPLLKLRRDQVWFTERDSGGATHLYPLSDFRPRKNENLERGYLQGRYGAVPFLEHELVAEDSGD